MGKKMQWVLTGVWMGVWGQPHAGGAAPCTPCTPLICKPLYYGIPKGYQATSRLHLGVWYIDPPNFLLSCCALERAATEFGCQGLELDFPIVGWGDDLRWQDKHWISSARQQASNLRVTGSLSQIEFIQRQ